MAQVIERYDEEHLFASNVHAATVNTVVVKSGEGELKRGSLLMRDSSNQFVLAGATVSGADDPSTKPWHELSEAGVYAPSADTVASKSKDYYSIVADATTQPTTNPKTEEYFERSGTSPYTYTPTTDTTVDAGKTYYAVTATKQADVDYGTETAYGTAECVLAVDCDATSADTVADVYITGDFWTSGLITGEGYSITEDDRVSLKNAGIYLIDGMPR